MKDFMVSVTCVVTKNERVLMVKEGQEHVKGKWDFPGGSMEGSETLEETARREVLEETGFKTEVKNLIGIYFGRSQRTNQLSIDFLVESEIEGKGEKNLDFEDEILEQEFFDFEEVGELELRKKNRSKMIKDFNKGKNIPLDSFDYSQRFKK